jgi:integrase
MSKNRRRIRGEGSVFYSPTKECWIGRIIVGTKPNGRPKYREVAARTQSATLARMRAAAKDAEAGRMPDGKPATVGQYLDHWIANVAKSSVHETTWNSYERCVRLHLKPRLSGIKLLQLRPFDVEAFFAGLSRDGVSNGNARKISEVLSTALEHAVRMGSIPANPVTPVAKPRPDQTNILPFTPEEILRIRLAAMGHRLEALFVLAVATGAREGELFAVGREHLDLDVGKVHFQRSLAVVKGGFVLKEPKNKRGRRVVELPSFAVDAIREHLKRLLAEGNASAPVIFCTRPGGFISKSSFVRQVYRPLLRKAGVPYRKFHTFRHTHISQLLADGESVVDVARRVGDSPETIYRSYAHAMPTNAGRLTARLSALYG